MSLYKKMGDKEYIRKKNCFDCYESQCTSVPTTEEWSKPLKYAIDAILQKDQMHGVFYVHVSAATGIFIEKIHATKLMPNGAFQFSIDPMGDPSLVDHLNLVMPYSIGIHDVSGILSMEMLQEVCKNERAFKEFVRMKYGRISDIPTYCATYPSRRHERARGESELKSKKALSYSNLGKWWAFARTSILKMDSVVQQTRTLRACALVDDFTETFYSQPDTTNFHQKPYYHTLKEVLGLPNETQLTEHVLQEYVADVIVSRLAICIEKSFELAKAAWSAHTELLQTTRANGSSAEQRLTTLKAEKEEKFDEWKAAVVFYAAEEVEHAMSTMVLYWRDSYILNLLLDYVVPTQRLNDAPGRDSKIPLCPVCGNEMIRVGPNDNCVMKPDSSQCGFPYYQCKYHQSVNVCSTHLNVQKTVNFDVLNEELPFRSYTQTTYTGDGFDGFKGDYTKGLILDIGTWRFSPEKHTKEISLKFLDNINDNVTKKRGPTPLSTNADPKVISLLVSPLLSTPKLFSKPVFAGNLIFSKIDDSLNGINIVTFRNEVVKPKSELGGIRDKTIDGDDSDSADKTDVADDGGDSLSVKGESLGNENPAVDSVIEELGALELVEPTSDE